MPTNQIYSYITTAENSAFTLATLQFRDGFKVTDNGQYTCTIHSDGEVADSSFVMLVQNNTQNSTVSPNIPPVLCNEVLDSVSFQIGLLTTACLTWGGTAQHITSSIASALKGGIYSQCQDCILSGDALTVGSPICNIEGSAYFTGIITTGSTATTGTILCALARWLQFEPTVLTIGRIQLIDVITMSAMECEKTGINIGIIFIAGPVVVVVVVILAVSVITIVIVVCARVAHNK